MDETQDLTLAPLLDLARRSIDGMQGAHAAEWMARLDEDYTDLVAALRLSLEAGSAEAALELAVALGPLWMSDRASEGRTLLERALALPCPKDARALRAVALYRAGLIAFVQGENATSRSLNEEALALSQNIGRQDLEADAWTGLARTALRDGDYAAVRRYGEAGLEAAATSGVPAAALWPGHLVAACAQMEGSYDEARRLYQQSLDLSNTLGNLRLAGIEHGNLAFVEILDGHADRAASHLRESISMARAVGDTRQFPEALIGLAAVLLAQGDGEEAAMMLGCARAALDAAAQTLDPPSQPVYDRVLAATRAQLDAATFDVAWQRGAAHPPDEVLATIASR